MLPIVVLRQRLRGLSEKEMFRINRDENGGIVFKVSGRMDSERVGELKTMLSAGAEGRRVVLDLSELILVNEDAVRFLADFEASGIELKNCPAYIRKWITITRQ